jgi:glycosyltransferase involved in cell wall biosynthesis
MQAALHGHDVLVITRRNNRPAIEAAWHESPVPRLQVHYVDLPRPFLAWKKRFGQYGLLSYYYFWQVLVFFVARRLHSHARFDLAHHVTFVNDWMPSGIAGVRVPFIWGPVGGSTHAMPAQMRSSPPPRSRRYEAVRRTLQLTLRRFDPFVELTRRRAAVILTYTREGLAGIPPRHRCKARPVVHIGVSANELPGLGPAASDRSNAFRVVTGGRLVHWKGFDLLIEGFAEFLRVAPKVEADLIFTGDGPFRSTLEELAETCGIPDRVQFLGWLAGRDDVYRNLMAGHLYALPTLRDGPPTAILEAMAAGKPVLCLRLGATDELVPDFSGFKIPAGSRSQIIAGIADALTWAEGHRLELDEMGRRARAHALEVHDWRRIGDGVDALYRSLVPERG